MKLVITAILAGTLAMAEEPKALTPREAADTLSEEELAQVVEMLRGNYIRPDALTDVALARAEMNGLLERLGAGARVFAKRSEDKRTPAPFRSEMLDKKTAHIRLGAVANLGDLDKALEEFAAKPPSALVLDLRATPHNTDYELAAEICRRFVPKGRILFSIKRPKVNDEEILTSRDDPRWRGLLTVLVDGDTSGSAEIIAAVLRTHLRAYVIGQRTQGEAAQFDELPLGGGKVLRIAVGEVTLPDSAPVFPGGLTPDLAVNVPQEKTDEVLAAALTAGAAPLVAETERARMTEASLIAGTNPELDALHEQQKQKAKGVEVKPPVRDIVLQRALDYITAIGIAEAAKVKRR